MKLRTNIFAIGMNVTPLIILVIPGDRYWNLQISVIKQLREVHQIFHVPWCELTGHRSLVSLQRQAETLNDRSQTPQGCEIINKLPSRNLWQAIKNSPILTRAPLPSFDTSPRLLFSVLFGQVVRLCVELYSSSLGVQQVE